MRDKYLESQVMTGSPQRLQLMLVEGALRFAAAVKTHWRNGQRDEATVAVSRCRRILTEILAGVRQDGAPLTRNVSAIYSFLFRTLNDAQREQSAEKLDDLIRVLQVEQQTWRQVCGRLATDATGDSATGVSTEA